MKHRHRHMHKTETEAEFMERMFRELLSFIEENSGEYKMGYVFNMKRFINDLRDTWRVWKYDSTK